MIISKTRQLTKQPNVTYEEFKSPQNFSDDIQYCWSLETDKSLEDVVSYKIIPDGCMDVVFEKKDILLNPGLSEPFHNLVEIKLEPSSKFIGIRFKPGKIRKYMDLEIDDLRYEFTEFTRKEFKSIEDFLSFYSKEKSNPLQKYGNDLNNLLSSSLSQRQKRRVFKRSTGFTIRTFNKIITFQRSLSNSLTYYDQSHMIKTYKELTNYTPRKLKEFM